MNLRFLFHRHTFVAILLCPILFSASYVMKGDQRSLLKDPGYELTPQFFKFISGGFWPASSDFLWIRTLQKIGVGEFTSVTLKENYSFYKLATSLDPFFYEGYDHSAVIFSFYYEASNEALDMIDRGIRVFREQNPPPKFWTHPYSLFLYRAYVNAFLKNDWTAAKQDYLNAAEIPGSPVYLQNMKVWLAKDGSESELAVRVLKLLIQNSTDPVIKAKYQEKLKRYE